ncbi:MAG TPA: hypothetical protein VKN63_00815 [Afifellaceae bacterium]|nr:hypothetical protein [Afifellaceae bacterium]
MRLLVTVFALLTASCLPLQAAPRPDARAMTCDQVRSLIHERGAAVITTGRYTYKRFVAHRGFCLYSERIGHEWISTSDTAECRLRICIEPLRFKRHRR